MALGLLLPVRSWDSLENNADFKPRAKSGKHVPPASASHLPPKAPHAHWMAVASVEIEASDGLHAVDAQLASHTVQVGQVHLDTADRHHAGQEEIHVPKLIPRHLQRWACQEVAGRKQSSLF